LTGKRETNGLWMRKRRMANTKAADGECEGGRWQMRKRWMADARWPPAL